MAIDVTQYGARGDGITLNTDSIQQAIDDCFLQGGGEVLIPEGRFLTGGLRIRSNVTLRLLKKAVLLGSTNPEDYLGFLEDPIDPIPEEERDRPVSTAVPGASIGSSAYPYSRWNNAIIRGIHAENVAILGEPGSEINGQNCFDPLGEENYRGPHAINLWFCSGITLQGYTIQDSANWAHAIQNSRKISLKEVTVLGGHDGFDVRTCDEITVENCRFLTGDDCIAGFDNINVTVRNCYFESACSILRFGGTNVLVENCTETAPSTYAFRGSLSDEEKKHRMPTNETHRRNCLNVFLYYCDQRAAVRQTPGNIRIRNCRFRDVDAVMRLPFGHIWCCNRSLRDITFENCTFEGICMPMRLICPKEDPLTVTMTDCTVSPRKGFEDIPFVTGEFLQEVRLDRVQISGFQNPRIINVTDT